MMLGFIGRGRGILACNWVLWLVASCRRLVHLTIFLYWGSWVMGSATVLIALLGKGSLCLIAILVWFEFEFASAAVASDARLVVTSFRSNSCL